MKASELVYLSETELDTKLAELKQELFNLRFQLATGQLQNTAALKQCKKDIARVMTIMAEKNVKNA